MLDDYYFSRRASLGQRTNNLGELSVLLLLLKVAMSESSLTNFWIFKPSHLLCNASEYLQRSLQVSQGKGLKNFDVEAKLKSRVLIWG